MGEREMECGGRERRSVCANEIGKDEECANARARQLLSWERMSDTERMLKKEEDRTRLEERQNKEERRKERDGERRINKQTLKTTIATERH